MASGAEGRRDPVRTGPATRRAAHRGDCPERLPGQLRAPQRRPVLSGALRGASGVLSGALRGVSGVVSGALRGASGPTQERCLMEEDWERPQYGGGGGDASVLLVVFGPKPEPLRVTSLAHRVVPMDLVLELEYQEPQVAAALLDSPSGATLLQGWGGEEPSVLTADGCMVMRAEVPDPKDLRYLRNCVGVVTAILEAGCRAAANLQSLGMFTPEQWRGVIFAPDKP